MSTRMASKRFSSEKSSVLTKEALADLNLHEFDILPNWEPTAGKIYTKVRAISARINQNFDGWPSEELKKSYRTFLGKPVFVNHVNDDPRKARGVVVAARFVENGDDKYIEVIQEVDADKFPMLAHELISGGLDSVSMGAEARICKCSYCGNEASDMLSMCSHVLSKKGQVLGRVNDDGTHEDVLIYEECRDISFFELSYVFDPADETAVVSNVLTANRKRGYGETSLPPQVDTLRDEEEDLAGYFIDPPREFQEPDLDEDYPVVEEGQPFGHRRDEEQREDVQMTRVSRAPRNRRNADSNINRVRDTGIDLPSLVGLEKGDWEGYERDFVNNQRAQGDLPPVLDYIQDNAYGRPTKDWEGNLPDEVIEYNPRQSNRRGRNMSHNRRARRRYAEEFGRNDQGEQEEVFISQTPPAEPVETGEGAADAPNNTKSDRVKTDQNRSNHTNLEARRRRARRRRASDDSHELYKDFLEYAQGQGMDLDRMQELYDRNYESNGMDEEADHAVRDFEEMMYDFLGVNSVEEDSRVYTLMDAPGSYEINHPYNFRGASRKRRSRRRGPRKTADYNGWSNWETWNTIVWYGNDPGAYDIAKSSRSPEELAENAPYVVGDDVDFDQVNWDEVYEAFEEDRTASRRRSNRRRPRRHANGVARAYDWDGNEVDVANTWQTAEELARAGYDVEAIGDDTEFGVSRDEVQRGVDNIRREIEDYDYFEDSYGGGKSYDHPAPRRRSNRRRMAEQSDDFNLNSRADIARDVEDEEVFISETGPQTQPKDASRRRALHRRRPSRSRRTANHLGTGDEVFFITPEGDIDDSAIGKIVQFPAVDPSGNTFNDAAEVEWSDGSFDIVEVNDLANAKDRLASRRRRPNRRRARSRRMAVNGWANWDTWHANMYLGDNDDIARDIAFADSGQQVADMFSELLEGTDVNPGNVDWDELHDVYSSDRDYYRNASRKRRSSKRRRMADTNLDLAAPDGRVNVEAPVKNTTDEEAQASQFDKRDFGNNAGDGIADPDLSTDQNWAPGEGQKTSTRASEIEGMRLAEAMVEAGLENQEDRWKLAEAYTKLPANIVRDRIALLARTASAKSAVRDDKSQRPVKSAQKAPGLGQRPTLQKSANKSDDYTLYL